MDKLKELRQLRAATFEKLEKLEEGSDDWTDEQRIEFDELNDEYVKLDKDIERLEKVQTRRAYLNEPAPTDDPPPVIEMGEGPQDRGFENFNDHLSAIINASVQGGYVDERLRRDADDKN